MNIIIQALIDAKDTLEIFRNRCNVQEWEKVSAQIAHLHYLATTTEVMPMLPSTVIPGDVLPASDTTLLRTTQAELKTHEGITTAGRAIAAGMVSSHDDPGMASSHDDPGIPKLDTLTPDDSVLSESCSAVERARSKPDTAGHPSEAYVGRDSKHAIRWVPEAPNHNGLYAFESKVTGDRRNCTCNISDAMQFTVKQQCIDWCDRHPVPKFVAMAHMFMTDCR